LGLAAIAVFVVAALGGWWWTGGALPGEPSTRGAYRACEGFVKERLKTPATVRFPDLDDDGVIATEVVEGEFHVNSYVDARDDHGVTARMRFLCVVSPRDSGWVLDQLDMPLSDRERVISAFEGSAVELSDSL